MQRRTEKVANILPFGDPRLRAVCKPITVFHGALGTKVDLMRNTLKADRGGAALAAPQIGFLRRVIVIQYRGESHEVINPVIEESWGEEVDYEGCLSLPGFVGRVARAERIRVGFQNRHGESVVLERSGEMARCFQHEIDHLDGILYIDRLLDAFVFNDRTKETIPLTRLKELTSRPYEGEV